MPPKVGKNDQKCPKGPGSGVAPAVCSETKGLIVISTPYLETLNRHPGFIPVCSRSISPDKRQATSDVRIASVKPWLLGGLGFISTTGQPQHLADAKFQEEEK